MQAIWVPWLHMHQPLVWKGNKLISNLQKMIESKDSKESWDGKLIARAYKNPAKYILDLRKKGYKPSVMLDFSGILLESLQELSMNGFFDSVKVNGEIIGNIIRLYKKVLTSHLDTIEFAGSAYAHCYFPVTPEADWEWQVEEWRNVFSKIFGKSALQKIKGFWLPEMGIIAYTEKLAKFIRILKKNGYEWIILPLHVIKGYEQLSYKKRISIAMKPHKLEVNGESITVIFSVPYYFIDQQAGVSAEYIYKQCLFTKQLTKDNKPNLIVTASDGENGNVMMNEFFPQTFTQFFTKFEDNKVSSLTISKFLKQFYPTEILDTIELKLIGGSWIGGHQHWILGGKRRKIADEIKKASDRVHESGDRKLKKLLLLAETSCYVYWGTDYWFKQGEKILKKINIYLDNAYKSY